MPEVHAVVLAAGLSARYGSHKLLLPTGAGHTVISRTVATTLGGTDGRVVVVLGREAERLRSAVVASIRGSSASRIRFVHNPRYRQGLGTSLATGISELVADAAEVDGVLIMLADQPLVGEQRVSELCRAFMERPKGKVAVAAAAGGKRRNPVVVAPELVPELLQLSDDEGARRLLQRRRDQVVLLEFGSGPWSQDIDSREDYLRLAAEAGWDLG